MSRSLRPPHYWRIRNLSYQIGLSSRDRKLDWRRNIATTPTDIREMEQTRSAQYQRFGNNGEVPWVKCWNTLRKAWRRLICIARSENRRAVDKETRQLIHMWQHVQPVSLSDREKS